jgi:acyl-coenzyme A thioesterase PaaI-like protein
MMMVCAAAWNGYRPMRAVDHTMQFVRPASCDVLAEERIVGTGSTTIFARVTLGSVRHRRSAGRHDDGHIHHRLIISSRTFRAIPRWFCGRRAE